jgi:hypothetical protein
MIIGTKFSGYSRDGVRRLYMGGGGAPTQSTSTSYQTNIPEYARPYVETMLGATQKQLFEGTPTEGGGFDITGFKPYQPYSTNPSDYVAGFSPMQQQSQQTIAGMQVPGQYQAAADITGAGIMGAADVGAQARAFNPMAQQAAGAGRQYQQMATDPNAISAYMSPYMQNVVDTQQREAVRQSDIQRAANMGQATQQGAFGGGRQAIIEAERQRNLGTQLGSIQAQGSQNAFQQAQQAQQYGTDMNLKGLQAGAGIYGQGLTAQQQAIQQALGGAGQLAGLGGQALEAQKGIAGLQNQYGAQQQSMEQQKINQAIQDYSNAQQYPLMQLGTMSNMLRGLPMQAQTTNQYVAAPNQLTQGIGMAGAGASLYNAFNPAAGRAPGMARGGIASVPQYDVGGEVESDLESMPSDALAREAKESPSPIIRQKAQRILRERQMEQSAAPQGIQYQAPQGMAGGGIIAFREPTEENNQSLVTDADARKAVREQDRRNLLKFPALLADAVASPVRAGVNAFGEVVSGAQNLGNRVINAFADTDLDTNKSYPKQSLLEYYNTSQRVGTPAAASAPARTPGGDSKRSAAPVAAETAPAAASIKAVPRPAARPAAPAAAAPAAITQASQNDMDSGAAVGGVGSTMPPTGIKAAYEEARAKGDRPLSDFSDEQAAELKRLGLDKSEGRDQERKNTMAELANAEDEAKRQKWLQAAKFFASWGSKPGPTLVAGMTALTESIPEFIAGEKEQKKAKRDAQKVLSTLEEAARQEKLGNFKEAVARKKEAGALATDLYKVYVQSEISSASDASRAASSKYSADMQLKAEEVRAAAAAADRAQRRGADEEEKKYRNYSVIAKNEENVLARIASERSDKDYQALQQKANMPDTVTGPAKTQRDEAIAKMKVIEDGWATRKKDAAARTEAARLRATGEAAPAPTDKGISKAEFDKLPSGARFTAPDGSIRTKP